MIHELISIFKQDYFKHTKDCISINKSIVSNLSDTMIFKLFFEYGFRSSKEILDLFVKRMNQANKRDPESVEYVVVKGFKPNILMKGK
mgnify:CR=1 FL=1